MRQGTRDNRYQTGERETIMLGDNIRKFRRQKNITQEELAVRLHVVRQTVSKWEKNISVPDAETLEKIAKELEVPVSKLLGASEEKDGTEKEEAEEIAALLAETNQHMAIHNKRIRWLTYLTIAILVILIGVHVVEPLYNSYMLRVHPEEYIERLLQVQNKLEEAAKDYADVHVTPEKRYFEATVILYNNHKMLVKPEADSWEAEKVGTQIYLPEVDSTGASYGDLPVGTRVGITWISLTWEDGYPAQLDTVEKIEVLETQ
jgi:putative transcriptional regulator